MKEEVRKVLDMLEKGQITASQASELLDAMDSFGEQAAAKPAAPGKRLMRIKIVSAEGKKVDLKVPAALVGSGISMSRYFSGRGSKNDSVKDLDWDQLSATVNQMLRDGTAGEIINIVSDEGDKVDIWLE
jgi:hypothetical protein